MSEALGGTECTTCGRVAILTQELCARCGGDVIPIEVLPLGTVWSSTTVHLDIPGQRQPYHLVYIDLDAGPRVLANVDSDDRPKIGMEVRVRHEEVGWVASVEVSK